MNEEWVTVQNFPNYEVSNMGNVRSKDRIVIRKGNPTKILGMDLKPRFINGYYRVTLYAGNRAHKKQYMVHRLVAEHFIENPHNYPYINHKDENKLNNVVDNLEWCTAKYNSNYGTSIQRRVAHQDWQSIADKQSIAVCQYSRDGQLIKEYKSLSQAERESDGYFKVRGISRNIKGYLKQYKGSRGRIKDE